MVHKIELPEKIRAWWFLRRSGLTRDQRQLTQLGDSNLTLDKAIKAMNFIIGQDSKVDGASSRWNKGSTSYKTNAYLAEDDEAWCDDEVYLEWDDYEAEGNEVLDGDETYYYDAENDTSPIDNAFNVDEYDDVFASYIDAKNHLNRMRTSRGFYPVVAMVQQPHRDGSLSAESQAMASALEETFMLKMFLKMLFEPQLNVKDAQDKLDMPTAIVTDCKALCDLIQREGVQSSLDKRVDIEALVIKDLIKQVQGQLRWVSSERQLADGLTKIGSRQQFVFRRSEEWMASTGGRYVLHRIQEEDSTGARSFQGINDFKDCFAGNCGLCERRDAEGIRRHWGQRLVAADLLHDVCLHPDHRQGGLVDDEIEPYIEDYHIRDAIPGATWAHWDEWDASCMHPPRSADQQSLRHSPRWSKNKQQRCRTVTSARTSSARTSRKPYVKFKVNEITTSLPGVKKNANPVRWSRPSGSCNNNKLKAEMDKSW